MIWIILAALGVPIWLIVGILGGSIWSRKKFQAAPGVFKCKLRPASKGWARMPSYARWVHDVLLVHSGLALARTIALPVASVEPVVKMDAASAPKKLGDDPTVVTLRLDGGSTVMLASPKTTLPLSTGPFGQAITQPVAVGAD